MTEPSEDREDKALTDAVMFVYKMLSKERNEIAVEPIELQEYIRELQRDAGLINRIDDICFALYTAIQDECRKKNGHRLVGLTYTGVVELVGKLCVYLIREERNKSQLADSGSVEDSEVSPVPLSLSYPDDGGNMLEGMLALIHGYTKKPEPTALLDAIRRGISDFKLRYPDSEFTVRIKPSMWKLWEDKLIIEPGEYDVLDDIHVPVGYIWVCKVNE